MEGEVGGGTPFFPAWLLGLGAVRALGLGFWRLCVVLVGFLWSVMFLWVTRGGLFLVKDRFGGDFCL
ncbi:hypothetical protein D5S17_27875 [Pseudonocardiaceae bacterium YIM PH 21723]|nr:hypothetical protein D5S17_27875 [Pseudonocardiaceae bacterium YIM PH 21723]